MDANGNTVSDFSGTINVADSATHLLDAAGNQVSALTGANAVTITNGVGTFQVQAGSTVGNTQTVTPSALTNAPSGVNITYDSVTVTQTAPAAAAVQVQVVPNDTTYLSANSVTSTTVQYALLDSAGNTASTLPGEYETFTISGPGSFADGSSVTSETLFVDGSENTIAVYSVQGQAGTITVSASGNGISGQVQIPSYVNTAPASLTMTSKQGTGPNGNPYTLYTVQLLDSNGHPVYNNTDPISVTSNAAAGTIEYGTINSSTGSFQSGSAPTVLADGQVQFAVRTVTVGTSPVTIKVQDTNPADNFSASANYNYVANAPTTITMSPASTVTNYTAEAGQQVTYSAQLTDGTNNVAEAGQTVTFGFSGSNTAGATLPNGLATGTYAATTNSQGIASVTVTIPTGAAGSFTLEGTYNSNTLIGGKTTVVDASAYGTQVVLAGQPTTDIAAGSPITGVTASVENADGTTLSGSTLLVTTSNANVVAVNGTNNGPTEEHVTASGATTLPNLVAGMAGTATITVQDLSDPAMPKATFTVNVAPGVATSTPYVEYNGAQVSSANPLSVTANTPVALTIVNVDAGGDPVPVAGSAPLTVSLSAPSGGSYRLTPNGVSVNDVQIQAGTSSTTVYYVQGTTGTVSNLKAQDDSDTLSGISYSSMTAGTASTVGLTMGDAFGNADNTFNQTVNVTISGIVQAPNGSYGTVNGTTITGSSIKVPVAFTNGQANLSLVLDAAGSQTLAFSTTSDGSIPGTTFTVNAGALASYSVTGFTEGTSGTVTVTAEDQYGNTVTTATGYASFVETGVGSSDTAGTLTQSSGAVTSTPSALTFTNGVATLTYTPAVDHDSASDADTDSFTDTITIQNTSTSPTITKTVGGSGGSYT